MLLILSITFLFTLGAISNQLNSLWLKAGLSTTTGVR